MPVKPPRGSGTHVDVPTSPTRSTAEDISLPGPSGLRGFDSGSSLNSSPLRAGTSDSSSVEAPHPSPVVVVHATPVAARSPAPLPSVDRYVTVALATLAQANSQGLRVFKQRTYAELSDGRIVLVGVDPETGHFRARLPSELSPSGPVLLRDTDSGFWSVREVSSSTTRVQVRKYLPEATDQHADDFISRFGDSDAAEAELKRIELGYSQLDREISAWEALYKDKNRNSHQQRLAIGAKVRDLYKWQGEPSEKVYRDGQFVGFDLNLHVGNRTDQLPVDFLSLTRLDSIVSLRLEGQIEIIGNLLLSFPHVEILKIHRYGVSRLPAGIETLTHLRALHVEGMTFSANDVDLLGRLTRLQELAISHSTLAFPFSVRGMTELRKLSLTSAKLTELPVGLSQADGPTRLEVLDLSGNHQLGVAPSVSGMSELRVLDLSFTGIRQLPAGLGTDNGPLRLEELTLSYNSLGEAPSLEGMAALQVVNLHNNRISRFPEGITSDVPKRILGLQENRIQVIPETIELRDGIRLERNPITDPASLRRLVAARRQTGADIWLGDIEIDLGVNRWLDDVPQAQHQEKGAVWSSLEMNQTNSLLMAKIESLSRTPEFRVERQILQRRVWSFLEHMQQASPGEQGRLLAIARTETSPGKMLDKLEDEIRKSDPTWQNQPSHHLPKRPRLE